MSFSFTDLYKINPIFQKKIAYFSMEFGIHQPLKTYAGGLGYLSGSHMRSAFELNQNMVGIGILWKYGYYNQTRKFDQTMDVLFEEKNYGFLQKTDIKRRIIFLHQFSIRHPYFFFQLIYQRMIIWLKPFLINCTIQILRQKLLHPFC
jgi:hypothetical protein